MMRGVASVWRLGLGASTRRHCGHGSLVRCATATTASGSQEGVPDHVSAAMRAAGVEGASVEYVDGDGGLVRVWQWRV